MGKAKGDGTISEKDENQDRGNWDSKADYLLSCIGYAVGLGNVWRFPYLAFQNGGGAFLIPYVIMLVFAGLPVYFLECALGQFSSLGPISCFKFSPILKGVGYFMVILNILVSIYYNIVIAYTIFYFFASLTSELPWESCDNFWNTPGVCSKSFRSYCDVNLFDYRSNTSVQQYVVTNLNLTLSNNSTDVFSIEQSNAEQLVDFLGTDLVDIGCFQFIRSRGVSPSEEYWENYVLQRSSSLDESGSVVIGLVLSLLVGWITIYFSLIRGVKSSGKVVWFTAIFPYLVLLILLIRGATLEGAYDGVQYYIGIHSDLSKLKEASVWQAAATQIFFSLSAAWGGLIALSSYNKFHNNCFYDSLIVCSTNCLTSFFAGFAIFTVVGAMAHNLGQDVVDVVNSGYGLAFVAYPEAISQLPISPFWAILFFLMLFTLGLDSQFTGVEAILTGFIDLFPRQLRQRRGMLTLFSIIFMFLVGIPCVLESGIYWSNLIDFYSANWGLLVAAILEVVGIAWIYGGNRFIEDIEMMIGKKSWWFWLYWRACWFFITPLLLIVILIWSIVTYEAPDYAGVSYPYWGEVLGWCSMVFGLMFVPIMALVAIIKNKGNIIKASEPSPDWGPYLKKFRGERYANMAEPYEALSIPREEIELEGKANPIFESEEQAKN